MCQLFINADQAQWQSKTRSMRIDGVITSIRLEQFFWHTLNEIATCDGMTVSQLITRLYYEALDADHDIGNFTSFLRVCCGRYLSLAADGDIQRETTSLTQVDANKILESEQQKSTKRQARLSAHINRQH